jgi:gas vesicle protein
MKTNSNEANLSYLVIGVGLGLIAGLLWAPRAGTEMRQQMRRGANDSFDYLATEAEKFGVGADRWIASSKNLLEQLRAWVSRARKRQEATFAQPAE